MDNWCISSPSALFSYANHLECTHMPSLIIFISTNASRLCSLATGDFSGHEEVGPCKTSFDTTARKQFKKAKMGRFITSDSVVLNQVLRDQLGLFSWVTTPLLRIKRESISPILELYFQFCASYGSLNPLRCCNARPKSGSSLRVWINYRSVFPSSSCDCLSVLCKWVLNLKLKSPRINMMWFKSQL